MLYSLIIRTTDTRALCLYFLISFYFKFSEHLFGSCLPTVLFNDAKIKNLFVLESELFTCCTYCKVYCVVQTKEEYQKYKKSSTYYSVFKRIKKTDSIE